MAEEVSTDKATWQASRATTIGIHQCRGLCLSFVYIIYHRIACVMYWLSVLYGLFHCVESPSGVPLDVFSPCSVSRHPPSAQPRVVPCGGTLVSCARSCVSCGGVPVISVVVGECTSVTAEPPGKSSWCLVASRSSARGVG